MTTKELINLLEKCNPDALVVMAKDGEGSSHSPLDDMWGGAYRAGEVGYLTLSSALLAEGYTEEDIISDGVPAVILRPVN